MGAEAKLALLTPKTLVPNGEGGGGIGALSAEDVAGALSMAKLPKGVYWYARAKYCLDASGVVPAAGALCLQMEAYLRKRGQQFERRQVAGLAAAIVTSNVNPPKCKRCRGRGTHKYRKRVVDCAACGATGRGAVKLKQMARMAGIPATTYRRNWMAHAACFDGWVSNWDKMIRRRIARQLSDRGG